MTRSANYKAKSLYIGAMEPKKLESYLDLYHAAARPALYSAPWWLDATCGGGGWDTVFQYDDAGSMIAALPYGHTRIRGLSAVITPPFTQWVSALQKNAEQQPDLPYLLSKLPRASIMDLSIKPDGSQPLITTALKYSYIIPTDVHPDQIRSGYNEGLRRNIRQAEKEYLINSSDDIKVFLSLCQQSYSAQKLNPPKWLDRVVPDIFKELISRKCGNLTIAGWKGKPIAGILTAWDQDTCYYLAGGRTSDNEGASAHALLLDQAIHSARVRGLSFDFEGSMHPGIANFFQSFGAIPMAYWNMRRYHGLGRLWALIQ